MSSYRKCISSKWPILIGILLIGFSSCKSKKNLEKTSSDSQLTKEEIIARFLAPADYSFFSGKAKLRITSDFGTDKGTLYIRSIPDSIIWMAVKRLSVEGGRILITPDSITFINRLEKSYSQIALDELEKRYGITPEFSYIQNMILGFNPKVSKDNISKVEEKESIYTLSTMLYNIYHEFDLEKNSGLTLGGRFNERFQVDGKWEYSAFATLSNGASLPYHRNYYILSGNNPDLNVNIDFSDIELNNPKEIRFNIPDHYQRVDIALK